MLLDSWLLRNFEETMLLLCVKLLLILTDWLGEVLSEYVALKLAACETLADVASKDFDVDKWLCVPEYDIVSVLPLTRDDTSSLGRLLREVNIVDRLFFDVLLSCCKDLLCAGRV